MIYWSRKESDFVGEKRRFNKAISGQIWLKVTLENDLLERVKKDIYLKVGILFYIFPPSPLPRYLWPFEIRASSRSQYQQRNTTLRER